MKLEEGMYVRTNLGIAKIIETKETKNLGNKFLLDKGIIDTHEDYYGCCMYDYKFYLDQVIKANHNIIDLIEVGDYVNGHQVIGKEIINQEEYVYIVKDRYGTYFKNSDIKSIVTKEQFEAMKYEIK